MERRDALHRLAALSTAILAPSASTATAQDLPAWIPAPGTRKNISRNTLADVDPCPNRTCRYSGGFGQQAILAAWCGAAFATDYGRLGAWITTGGGHDDYYGNEVYAFELDTQSWVRLNDPFDGGPNSEVDYAEGEYAPGLPLSSHTYQHTQYLPRRFGGGPRGSLLTVVLYAAGKHGRGSGRAHACDLDTGRWSRYSVNKAEVAVSRTSATAFDASRGLVWRIPTGASDVETLNLTDRTFRKLQVGREAGINFRVHHTCGRDEARDCIVVLDWRQGPPLSAWILDCESPLRWRPLQLVGDGPPPETDGMGLEWCPPLGCLVGYEGRGAGVVRKLVPPDSDALAGPWRWEVEALAGDPPVHRERGPRQTFSRFRWAPSISCFLFADDRRSAVQAWRLRGT